MALKEAKEEGQGGSPPGGTSPPHPRTTLASPHPGPERPSGGPGAPPSLAPASPAPAKGPGFELGRSIGSEPSLAFRGPSIVERSRHPVLRVEVGFDGGTPTGRDRRRRRRKPEVHIPGDLCSFPTSSSGSPERGSRARAARTPAEQHAYTCPISSNQIHTARRLHTHACSPPAAFSRPAVPRGPARRSPTPTIRPAAPQHTRAAPRGAHLLDLGGAFPPLA